MSDDPVVRDEINEDTRRQRLWEIYQHHKEDAEENVIERLWKTDGDNVAAEALGEITQTPAMSRAVDILQHRQDDCTLGRIWREAVEDYLESYMEEHQDDVWDEAMRIEGVI